MEASGPRPGRLTRRSEGSLWPLRTRTPTPAQAKHSPGGKTSPPAAAQPPSHWGTVGGKPQPGHPRGQAERLPVNGRCQNIALPQGVPGCSDPQLTRSPCLGPPPWPAQHRSHVLRETLRGHRHLSSARHSPRLTQPPASRNGDAPGSIFSSSCQTACASSPVPNLPRSPQSGSARQHPCASPVAAPEVGRPGTEMEQAPSQLRGGQPRDR